MFQIAYPLLYHYYFHELSVSIIKRNQTYKDTSVFHLMKSCQAIAQKLLSIIITISQTYSTKLQNSANSVILKHKIIQNNFKTMNVSKFQITTFTTFLSIDYPLAY
jgi:hypothetical protein